MRILIRADGDRHIGIGHLMRMLALAERVVAAGGSVMLATVGVDRALGARMGRAGVTVESCRIEPGTGADGAWVIRQATSGAADWVVVDGYRFDASYQDALRAAGLRVLFVDDRGACEHYAAHLVLNQNVLASSTMYERRRDDTRLLLGPAYALIRQEFVSAAADAPVIAPRADRILVTLGGADPDNATERILDVLVRVSSPDIRIKILVGPSNPHGKRLVSHAIDQRMEVLPAVDDVAPLMAWADLAIAGAGTTVYELACLGVPTLVVAIAEYQRDLARALDRERMCANLGWHETLAPAAVAERIAAVLGDRTLRAEMSRRARERVDGLGAERVLDAMRQVASV